MCRWKLYVRVMLAWCAALMEALDFVQMVWGERKSNDSDMAAAVLSYCLLISFGVVAIGLPTLFCVMKIRFYREATGHEETCKCSLGSILFALGEMTLGENLRYEHVDESQVGKQRALLVKRITIVSDGVLKKDHDCF
jgi:hypothetical protein